jgi:hypothetical protein
VRKGTGTSLSPRLARIVMLLGEEGVRRVAQSDVLDTDQIQGRLAPEAIASHRVGGRPDRYEPRVRKRRPKEYPLLKEPREQARERLTKAS